MFWNNFLAGLFSGIVLFFLTIIYKWVRRQKLKMILIKDNSEDDWQYFHINIRNSGKAAFKINEVYWHIYFPKERECKILNTSNYPFFGNIDAISEIESGIVYDHYNYLNKQPLFPGKREIRILEFRIKIKSLKTNKIYYHFSTVAGIQPNRFRSSKKIQDREGNVRLNLLPFIEIK